MLTQQSRVLVQDKGYVKAGTLEEGVHALWNGEGVSSVYVTKVPAQPLFNIEFTNGKEVSYSGDQKIKTMQKRLDGLGYTLVEKLEKNHLVCFTKPTYRFDYLDLLCYNYINKLSSYEIGVLAGLIHVAGVSIDDSLIIVDLPLMRDEAISTLKQLLGKAEVSFEKTNYFKRTDRITFRIEDRDFVQAIKLYKFKDSFPEFFWTSLPLLEGIIKSLFTFGLIGKEMFTIRANKDSEFLKEVQDVLLLLGINSSYTRGLKVSQLTISKNNCYRFAQYIGVFNAEVLFSGVDFNRFIVYNDRTMKDMRYGSILRIRNLDSNNDLIDFSMPVMADGLILR